MQAIRLGKHGLQRSSSASPGRKQSPGRSSVEAQSEGAGEQQAFQRPSFIPLSLVLRRYDRPVMGDNVVHEPVSILHYKVRTLDAPC